MMEMTIEKKEGGVAKKTLLGFIFLFFLLLMSHGFTEEMLKKWGEVNQVYGNQMNLKYIDPLNQEVSFLQFEVPRNVSLEGVKSVGEIKRGDFITVEYKIKENGSAIACNISVPKKLLEKEEKKMSTSLTNLQDQIDGIKRDIEEIKKKLK